MIERRWIDVQCRGGNKVRTQAFIIGQCGIHRSVMNTSITTVTHLKSGYSIGEFSSMLVAFRFAAWLNAYIDLDNTPIPPPKDLVLILRMRRLHACYIPRKDDIRWIKKNAPNWLLIRHSELVL